MVDNIKKKRLKTGLDILLGAENSKKFPRVNMKKMRQILH